MRFPVLLAALLALVVSTSRVAAQNSSVMVELEMEQDRFIPSEDIKLAVRVINLSGGTLRLGAHNGWVKFFIESKDGRSVVPDTEPYVMGEFDLPTSKTGIKRLNLVPHFPLKLSGRYTIRAEVEVPGWAKPVASEPLSFDILNGTVMRTITFGVPKRPVIATPTADGKSAPTAPAPAAEAPEQRNFLLQRANFQKEDHLYVRVTDLSGATTLKVQPIGRLIPIGELDLQVDQMSHLHVLYRTDRQTFGYAVITPDGDLVVRQTHDITTGYPRLRLTAENKVIVAGGVRRERPTDIPSPADVADNAIKNAP